MIGIDESSQHSRIFVDSIISIPSFPPILRLRRDSDSTNNRGWAYCIVYYEFVTHTQRVPIETIYLMVEYI